MSIITNSLTSLQVDSSKVQENAEFFIKNNGFDHTKDYGINTREGHLKLIQFVVDSKICNNPEGEKELIKYIEKYNIFNDIELASLIVTKNPLIFINNVEKFRIEEESDRVLLIKLIKNSFSGVWLPILLCNFDKFQITSPNLLDEVINLFVQNNQIFALLMSFDKLNIRDNKQRYLKARYLAELAPDYFIRFYKNITISDSNYLPEWIAFLTTLLPPKDTIEYFEKTNLPTIEKYEIAQSILVKLVGEENCPIRKKVVTSFLDRISKYKNKNIKTFLTIFFLAHLSGSSQYFEAYQSLTTNGKKEIIQHLLLPMVIIASWVNSKEDMTTATEIAGLLCKKNLRKSLRSSTGMMQDLLQILRFFKKKSNDNVVGDEKKLNAIYQALVFSKDNERECKKAFNALLFLLSSDDQFNKIIDDLSKNYIFDDLMLELPNRVESFLHLKTPIDDFNNKYTKFEEKMRIPHIFIKYVLNLHNEKIYDMYKKEIEDLVYLVLENKVQDYRYSTDENAHLRYINEKFPTIFSRWKVSLENQIPQINATGKKVISVDTDDPQDLFLCGTEVDKSCMRVDGDPFYNIALLSYVLDGKNRLLAIKNAQTGKIYARCILRLLLDDKTKSPVLFQEQSYGEAQYINQLNELAKNKAKELNIPLYTIKSEAKEDSSKNKIISLGASIYPEYSDGEGGLVDKEGYRIFASRVN